MLRIKSSAAYLRKLKSGNFKPIRQELLNSYSSKARTPRGGQRWRTQIISALGGGLAVGVGLVASLWYWRSRGVSLVGLEEAGCKERHRWRGKDTSPWSREVGAEAGLHEARKRLRDLLRRIKDEAGSPGIVVAVSVDGKLLWAEGMGYADVENRLPCTSKSVHRIASISKSLTMTAVAKLWEEGKLDLDKPIQHYVPEFPEKEVDGKKVEITTRQLVSHLAGIRHYSKDYIKELGNQTNKDGGSTSKPAKDSKTSSENNKNKDAKKTTNKNGGKDTKEAEFYETKDYSSVVDALELFKDDPLRHKPGNKYYYTTHGWTLVSAVVDAAANEDFLTYMKTIFKDLGMTHTVPDEATCLIYNRARGYTRNEKGKLVNVPAVNLSHKWAGGGFLSDVRDLVQFGNAMLYSYQYSEEHKDLGLPPGYLKPETMKTIWSPVPLTKNSSETDGVYAMGWRVLEKSEHKGFCPEKHEMVWHTGGAVGASSVLLVVNQGQTDTVSTSRKSPGRDTSEEVSTLGNPPHPNDNPEKHMVLSSQDSLPLPKGIVVAMIVNLEKVSLFKAAVEIAQEFQNLNRTVSEVRVKQLNDPLLVV